MAWIQRDPSGNYHVGFRLGARKFKRSLKTKSEETAQHLTARLEENIILLARGRLELPTGADAGAFLLSDGKLTGKPQVPERLTLARLFKLYFDSLPERSLEPTTLYGMRIHERQLYRVLGKSFDVCTLTMADLQRYVEKRSKDPGRRGRKVTPATIKKAIVTLRTLWNWGVNGGHLNGRFPTSGLKYPKAAERPPFQTWAEIEQQIARGGFSKHEQADLWDCLFLTVTEIDELLTFVKERARQPWIYPAACLAAHTGARRSEVVRSRLADIDLAAGSITIHERKRNHEMRTTRRVPISPFLADVLSGWFAVHPGGPQTFCHVGNLTRSKKQRPGIVPITCDEAHDHFKRTLEGSKWSIVRGWHIFRHSFCSNCAAKGIDQRLINGWVGHQTEEMTRRYRHLFPDEQRSAIVAVFGKR